MLHMLELLVASDADWPKRASSLRMAFDAAPNPFHALVDPGTDRAARDGQLRLIVQADWDWAPLPYSACAAGTRLEVRTYRGAHMPAEVVRRWEAPAARPPRKRGRPAWPKLRDMEWAPLDVHRTLSPGAWGWVRMGLTPTSMDDRWHAFEEDGVMRWHRKMTGQLVYRATLASTGDAWTLGDVFVSQEQRDVRQAAATFGRLIDDRAEIAARVLGDQVHDPTRAEGR